MKLEVSGISLGSHYKLGQLPDYLVTSEDYRECPICASSEIRSLFQMGSEKHSIKKVLMDKMLCGSCGHSFFNKRVSNEQLKSYYENIWNEAIQNQVQHYNVKPNYSEWSPIHYLKDLNISREARILDFGCGTGDSLLSLRNLGYQNIYGVEIGRARAEISRKLFPNRIFQGDEHSIAEIVEKIGKFDLIYSNHVFEHIAQPQRVISKLSGALKDDGILAISVPAPGSETFFHSALYYPHLHAYSALSLKMYENAHKMHFAGQARSTNWQY